MCYFFELLILPVLTRVRQYKNASFDSCSQYGRRYESIVFNLEKILILTIGSATKKPDPFT